MHFWIDVYFYKLYIFIRKMKTHQPLWSTLITNPHKTSLCNKKRKNCYAWAPYLFNYFLYSIYLSWFNSLFVSWFYFQSRLNTTVRVSQIIKLNYNIKFLTLASLRQESYMIVVYDISIPQTRIIYDSRCCRFMLINLADIRFIIWNVVLKHSGCNKQTS